MPALAGLVVNMLWTNNGVAQDTVPLRASSWMRIATNKGQHIGGIALEHWKKDDFEHRRSTQIIHLVDHNDRRQSVIEVTETLFDKSGKPFKISTRNTANKRERVTEIRLFGGKAFVKRSLGGGLESERAVILPANLRYDNGVELVGSWSWNDQPILSFSKLATNAENLIERIELQRDAVAEDGSYTVIRRSFGQYGLRSVSILRFSPDHRLLATDQELAGFSVKISPGTADDMKFPARPLRPVRQSMIKSPYKIGSQALAGKIRYRFNFKNGGHFDPPETHEQKLTKINDAILLDICMACGPEHALRDMDLEAARQPTEWLQSDDPMVKRMAQPIGQMKIDDTRKMQLLATSARKRLTTIDFMGHYSAAEALRARRGDCTEDALVLAALGRAVGIPTKVASGLVYTREAYHGVSNAFMPHSWTLAWIDGRWKSFDMSLDGFDASHIALTISDGEAEALAAANRLAGLLEWEMVAEVRTAKPRSLNEKLDN